jgi:hypothetical protein
LLNAGFLVLLLLLLLCCKRRSRKTTEEEAVGLAVFNPAEECAARPSLTLAPLQAVAGKEDEDQCPHHVMAVHVDCSEPIAAAESGDTSAPGNENIDGRETIPVIHVPLSAPADSLPALQPLAAPREFETAAAVVPPQPEAVEDHQHGNKIEKLDRALDQTARAAVDPCDSDDSTMQLDHVLAASGSAPQPASDDTEAATPTHSEALEVEHSGTMAADHPQMVQYIKTLRKGMHNLLHSDFRIRFEDITWQKDKKNRDVLWLGGQYGAIRMALLYGRKTVAVKTVQLEGKTGRAPMTQDEQKHVTRQLVILQRQCPQYVFLAKGVCMHGSEAHVMLEIVAAHYGL